MLNIEINHPLKVSYCGAYNKMDGTTGYYIKCIERDQPTDGKQSKSTDYAMFWLPEMPEGVVPGTFIIFDGLIGVRKRTFRAKDADGIELKGKYGEPLFETMYTVIAERVTKYPPVENAKPARSTKKSNKAE